MLNDHCKPKESSSDAITSLCQQVETLKKDVSIWKASSEKWAQRHAEVHAQVETLTQELQQSRAETEAADATTGRKMAEIETMWQQMLAQKRQLASLAAAQERMTEMLKESEADWRRDAARYHAQSDDASRDQPARAGRLYGQSLAITWAANRLGKLLAALPSLAASSRETTDETKDTDTRVDSL